MTKSEYGDWKDGNFLESDDEDYKGNIMDFIFDNDNDKLPLNIKIKAKKLIKIKAKKANTRADKVFDGIKYYYKQDRASNQKGNLLFKYGMKLFSKVDNVKEFIEIAKNSNNPQFFEICDKNVKLMADIEAYTCTDYEMILNFKNFLKDIFTRLKIDFDDDQCFFLVDDSKKSSMHFIYNNGFSFINNGERSGDSSKYSQWEFWEFAKNILFKDLESDGKTLKYKNLIQWKKQGCGNGSDYSVETSCIDFAVYTRNRAMRIMHSYKDEKKGRTFYPAKINNEKKTITLKKKKKILIKYLINDYSDKTKSYKIEIPLPENKYKVTRHNLNEVYEIILEHVDDVEVIETRDNLVELRNTSERTCLISGNIDKTDNCYVVIRRDGLYFYCHDDECNSSDYESVYESDGLGGVCIYKFQKSTKCILDRLNRENKKKMKKDDNNGEVVKKVEEIVYDDISRMLSHMETEECEVTVKGKAKPVTVMTLTEEYRTIITDWANETIKYVNDGGCESLYVKSRIYDHKLKSETIEWVKRTTLHIFKNKDFLSYNCAQFSPKLTFKTLGPLVEYFVRTHKIDRFDKVTCIPYFDKKPKLRYTLNLFSEFYLKKEMREKEEWDDIDINLYKKSWTYKHIEENVCASSKDLFKYHMKFLSHSIQKPDEKPEVCLVFYGKGGVGKDITSKFHGNVMGANLFHAYKSLDELNTNFNTLNKNKLFVVVDEVDDKASRKNHNDFKHFIVMEFEKIEPKGIDPDYFPCYKRIIANTNYRDSWRVEHDCRRLVMYEFARGLLGNKEWINHLVRELKDINILKSAFKYYATLDIDGFNPRNFPMTDYKKQQASMNVKSSFQFLNYLTELDELRSDLSKDLYVYCVDKDDMPEVIDNDESDDEEEKISPDYPQTASHSYDFKIKDMYNIYKKFCEEFSLNMCKPPAFKQDMMQMGCCPMNNNKSKKFRSKAYNNKPITGFKVVNKDLKKKLVDELGINLDLYKF